MKRKNITINRYDGKSITIDEPTSIKIIIPKMNKPFIAELKIDEKFLRGLFRKRR